MSTGRLSVSAEEESTVSALLALERDADAIRVRNAYAMALQRWPCNIALLMGFGNAAYAAGDRIAAAAAFRRATEEHPDSATAFNNLASILAELGEFKQACAAAHNAVALGGPWRDTALMTLREIDAAQRK
jgi:Flp pilus assembly protein TadD